MLLMFKDLDTDTKELSASVSAKYTAVAADATADELTVVLDDLPAIDMLHVQILRAGVDVKADAKVTITGTSVKIEDGAATYAVTAGDVVHIFATGTRKE